MIGYKVCLEFNGYYLAAFPTINPYVDVYYSFDTYVAPKKGCGPLCVFDTLDNAIMFSKKYCINYTIFECDYETSEERTIYRTESYPFSGEIKVTQGPTLKDLPVGTALASKVVLIKKIDWKQ